MQVQRTILWIVFSMSLLFLWDSWQKHNGKPSMFGGAPTTQADGKGAVAAKADGSVPSAPVSATPPSGAAGVTAAVPGAQAATGSAMPLVTVRSDVLALDIDPVGGQVRRAELIEHKAGHDSGGKLSLDGVLLLRDDKVRKYVAQSGLVGAPQGSEFPTHLTQFTVADGPRELAQGKPAVALTLVGESGGLKVTRTYTLERGSYAVKVRDEIMNTGEVPLKPALYMQLLRDNSKPEGESQFYSTYTGPAVYTEEHKFHKVDFGDIEKGKADFAKTASDGWVGIIQHYFVSAWIPADKVAREFYASKVDGCKGAGEACFTIGIKQPLAELAPKASASVDSRLLIAPQDQHMLEKVAPGLDLSVDYGWLTVIAKPIFWLLQTLYGVVQNWGWAIVLLTIVIKTAFFPLQAASYKSMARMKAVTPRLMQLRERYGDDRVKLNTAMMELYKEEKINPLGGCLPIVVQIPVFIALYWVLLASVEMRNASWALWIHDLAAPDPYYVLPLIMAGTMFLQTRMNPTPPDPVQAKVMMFMPIVFSVMFFFFPSGLVLYWLVNNCYSIAQQWYITRKFNTTKGDKSDKSDKKKK